MSLSNTNKITFESKELMGKSKIIKEIKESIKKVAKVDHPVLLFGETGVGKELAARKIHYLSSRKNHLFTTVNCANLAENLVESELFGYRKGAFTDAKEDKIGLIEQTNHGTLFFDEISELSSHLQAKLLRVIEFREIRRLGETRTKKIDIRFIFSTNRDLGKEITAGRFRKDLYYRISTLELYIPSLRERKEDIPLLVESILKEETIEQKRKVKITQKALKKLQKYTFPGNVRELENIVKRAATFSVANIKEEDIQFPQELNKKKTKRKSRHSIEQIMNALKQHGNKTKAAKELGISRRHIYRLLNFKE